jgi:hypothetical protein
MNKADSEDLEQSIRQGRKRSIEAEIVMDDDNDDSLLHLCGRFTIIRLKKKKFTGYTVLQLSCSYNLCYM